MELQKKNSMIKNHDYTQNRQKKLISSGGFFIHGLSVSNIYCDRQEEKSNSFFPIKSNNDE
jgi:hypothetical protein